MLASTVVATIVRLNTIASGEHSTARSWFKNCGHILAEDNNSVLQTHRLYIRDFMIQSIQRDC